MSKLQHMSRLIVAVALITSLQMSAGSRFGETFGATALGSALGSTVGTALGNAMSCPRPPCRKVTEVVVKDVYVPNEMPARRVRQLEKEERALKSQLTDLRSRKHALERRLSSLEQELNEIEATIDLKAQGLKALRAKREELCEPAPSTPRPMHEVGEFKV